MELEPKMSPQGLLENHKEYIKSIYGTTEEYLQEELALLESLHFAEKRFSIKP